MTETARNPLDILVAALSSTLPELATHTQNPITNNSVRAIAVETDIEAIRPTSHAQHPGLTI